MFFFKKKEKGKKRSVLGGYIVCIYRRKLDGAIKSCYDGFISEYGHG
jgi:hypothetical protein